ncbi:hypothetical protein [Barnesiella intestinihominis]
MTYGCQHFAHMLDGFKVFWTQETGVKGSRCVNDDIGRGNE